MIDSQRRLHLKKEEASSHRISSLNMQMSYQREQFVTFPQNWTHDKLVSLITMGCAPETAGPIGEREGGWDYLYNICEQQVTVEWYTTVMSPPPASAGSERPGQFSKKKMTVWSWKIRWNRNGWFGFTRWYYNKWSVFLLNGKTKQTNEKKIHEKNKKYLRNFVILPAGESCIPFSL